MTISSNLFFLLLCNHVKINLIVSLSYSHLSEVCCAFPINVTKCYNKINKKIDYYYFRNIFVVPFYLSTFNIHKMSFIYSAHVFHLFAFVLCLCTTNITLNVFIRCSFKLFLPIDIIPIAFIWFLC